MNAGDSSGTILDDIEGGIGAFFVLLVATMVLTLGGLFVSLIERKNNFLVGGAVWLGAVYFEGIFIYRLAATWRGGVRSLAPRLAMRMPIPRWFLRPFVLSWYFVHFAFAVIMSFSWDSCIAKEPLPQYSRGLLCAAVTFILAFASNVYALMAIRGAGAGEATINRAWRWRVAVDLALAAAAVVQTG